MYEIEWTNSNAAPDCQAQHFLECPTIEAARIDAQFYANRDKSEVFIYHRYHPKGKATFVQTVLPQEPQGIHKFVKSL